MINPAYVEAMVKQALAEDVGAGDVTANLIPAGTRVRVDWVDDALQFSASPA